MRLLLTLLLLQGPGPLDASKIDLGPARTIAVVDIDKIRGEPWRLCWSPDGREIYLAAMKRARDGSMDMTHHVIDVAAGTVKKVDAEPPWAAKYWEWKSWKHAPATPAFAIELDSQRKNQTATARPMGGDLARGGTSGGVGTSVDEVAGQMSTNVLIITMMLKGEVIGRWENEPMVPGLTFGWGPAGTQSIAFANQDGRLMVLDQAGRKQRIDGSKDVRLPAWSGDARQLAWAERQDRKKFRVQVAGVSSS